MDKDDERQFLTLPYASTTSNNDVNSKTNLGSWMEVHKNLRENQLGYVTQTDTILSQIALLDHKIEHLQQKYDYNTCFMFSMFPIETFVVDQIINNNCQIRLEFQWYSSTQEIRYWRAEMNNTLTQKSLILYNHLMKIRETKKEKLYDVQLVETYEVESFNAKWPNQPIKKIDLFKNFLLSFLKLSGINSIDSFVNDAGWSLDAWFTKLYCL